MKPILAATTLTLLGCIACQRGPEATAQLPQHTDSQAPAAELAKDTTQQPTVTPASQNSTAPTSSCNLSQAPVPLAELSEDAWIAASNLYFRPYDVEVTPETLVFKNNRYTFTFCRADQNWSVEPAISGQEETWAFDDPDAYVETTLADQVYQAKVTLTQNFDAVVFELVLPDTSEPIVQTLYDPEKMKLQGFGAELGGPFISKTVTHDGSLWWAINFEQGEGFSGVATVVQYRPGSDTLQVWQPEALGSTRIMDMVVTGSGDDLALWLGTQYSGEGMPDIPAKGLVTYRPSTDEVTSYTVDNSPLVGAIPSYLVQVDDHLWAATANGVCAIPSQTPSEFGNWNCWRFTAEAELPTGGVPLHQSLLDEEPITILSGETVEVLWANFTNNEQRTADQQRFEVRYPQGFTTTLEQGAEVWGDYALCEGEPLCGFYWVGRDWHWDGQQFVRSHDEATVNYIGGGPQGLGDSAWAEPAPDWQVMRGDFDLLALDDTETRIRYYSGWVDADALEPYIMVMPQPWRESAQPNPLLAVRDTLPVQGE